MMSSRVRRWVLRQQVLDRVSVGQHADNLMHRMRAPFTHACPSDIRVYAASVRRSADTARYERAPRIASSKPSTVKTDASTVTSIPNSRAVAEVIGPMEATLTPARASAPAMATKFRTVEELVKVIQSGFSGRSKAPSGTAVR